MKGAVHGEERNEKTGPRVIWKKTETLRRNNEYVKQGKKSKVDGETAEDDIPMEAASWSLHASFSYILWLDYALFEHCQWLILHSFGLEIITDRNILAYTTRVSRDTDDL